MLAGGIWKASNAKIFQDKAVTVTNVLFLAFLQAEERNAFARPLTDQCLISVNWNSHFCNLQKLKTIYFS